MPHYDVIVIGVGGVGSAALHQLAARGAKVLGIDRFAAGHDRGSSHGQTRLIRQAYFEHPDYVPLLRRAFELWQALEGAAGEALYRQVGLIQIGPANGEVVPGVRESARLHRLEIDNLSPRDMQARFPSFRLPADCEAIFERRAGYLLVERAVIAQARLAAQLGAKFVTGETVTGWRAEGTGVFVETDRARYSADRLILAAGPWASTLLNDLNIPLVVRRKPLYWWQTSGDTYRADRGCPAYLYELPHGCFYGVPQIDEFGIKVAEHTGGALVTDPLAVDRQLDAADQARVAGFVRDFLPQATTHCTQHAVCMYTLTPDAHFVVDRHPEHPQVAFAAGLSGHGFKFTGVLGEALTQLTLDGHTTLPIGFLSLAREGLR